MQVIDLNLVSSLKASKLVIFRMIIVWLFFFNIDYNCLAIIRFMQSILDRNNFFFLLIQRFPTYVGHSPGPD